MQPSVHGELPVSTSGQDSGSLYDAATIQGNREAAAQCACKAEEALQQRDFDKAVSACFRDALYHICLGSLKGLVSVASCFQEVQAFVYKQSVELNDACRRGSMPKQQGWLREGTRKLLQASLVSEQSTRSSKQSRCVPCKLVAAGRICATCA